MELLLNIICFHLSMHCLQLQTLNKVVNNVNTISSLVKTNVLLFVRAVQDNKALEDSPTLLHNIAMSLPTHVGLMHRVLQLGWASSGTLPRSGNHLLRTTFPDIGFSVVTRGKQRPPSHVSWSMLFEILSQSWAIWEDAIAALCNEDALIMRLLH